MLFHALMLAAASQNVSCNREPAMLTAVPARVPDQDQGQIGRGRIAVLAITVGENGHVTDAKVYSSSGSQAVDAAALAAARSSIFTPGAKDCQAAVETVLIDEVVRPDYAGAKNGKCTTPFQNATVLSEAQPAYPASARGLRGQRQVAIAVTIDPDGDLESATVESSTGNMALDRAALDAARATIYAPELVNCLPVTGIYLFKVTFDPNA